MGGRMSELDNTTRRNIRDRPRSIGLENLIGLVTVIQEGWKDFDVLSRFTISQADQGNSKDVTLEDLYAFIEQVDLPKENPGNV